ncbi:MAG: hypothetical protein ACXV5N_10070, partial [Halobacteriota archaeon]
QVPAEPSKTANGDRGAEIGIPPRWTPRVIHPCKVGGKWVSYIEVKALADIQPFVSVDDRDYTLKQGDRTFVPESSARVLWERNLVGLFDEKGREYNGLKPEGSSDGKESQLIAKREGKLSTQPVGYVFPSEGQLAKRRRVT